MGCGSSTVVQMETRGLIYIYYGTTSGNSSRLAFQFADQIKKLKFIPKVINLSEFQPELMISSRLNVFFVSTYGVGACTNDALTFNEWIFSKERSKSEFEQMSYMVFALGNTYHEHYCQFGIKLDGRLEELGAKRLVNLGKGNAAENTTEQDYEQWYNNGVEASVEEFFPLFSYEQGKFDFSSYKIVTSKKPEIETSNNLEYDAKRYCESHSFTVKEIRQLKKKPTFGNSTFFIDLQVEGIKYQTAGNIAIYPENTDQDIQDLCHWLKLDQKRVFEIITKSKQPFPNPISVYNYLKKYCDFLGPITKKQLMELANLTVDKAVHDEIIQAAAFQGREIFEEKYLNKKENLLSLLKHYNIRQLSLEQLVEICPLIAPRYFTIASSSTKYPNNIHIVASELKLTETRAGLCSLYFKNLKQGDKLKGFLQKSSFTFPLNKKSPILLIGPGAGLAPMRALIQEKDYHLENNQFDTCPLQGPMTLFFGCRTHDDILFEEELKEYYKNGTLSSLRMAFSRENPKEYVTDFMDLQMIQDHLTLDGVIYVCGSSNMGKDVTNKIEDMYKQLENVQPYMAFKKISDLQEKQQLITEFWG